MPKRWWIEQRDHTPKYVDWAPPVRVIAVVTLITATLDLLADFIMAIKISHVFRNFTCPAYHAAIAYFFFIGCSVLIYIVEFADCIITVKQNRETRWLCKLSRSLYLIFEEVPIAFCFMIIFLNQPHLSLVSPGLLVSCIKLVALTWGIVKFVKIRFCWFCMPCCYGNGLYENIDHCFTFTLYRTVMLIVNLFHILAIILVIINIVICSRGGVRTPEYLYPPCYPEVM